MNTWEEEQLLARRIAERVQCAGGRVYYVGGYVRDKLMGIACKDIDLEVYGIEPRTLREILAELGEVYDRGASFGVLGLRGSDIDIAMPRTESRTGDRHTDFDVCVDPFLAPERACRRRDFTINAMLLDVLSGELLDFYGGQADLDARIIRCVAGDTFIEDALRVFRAAQFAARLNARIDEETLKLCASMDVRALSFERVLGETEKALLKADSPSVYFWQLQRMNQLDFFFSELAQTQGIAQSPKYHPEGDVFTHTMIVLDEAAGLRCRAKQPLGFMLSALLHDLGKCVATKVEADGRITAHAHEVLGLPLVERQLARISRNEQLKRYVLNLVSLHMRPNMLCAAQSRKSKTRKLFDMCVCPEDLILLSRADASGKKDAPYNERNELWLLERLEDYRKRAEQPMVGGRDLIEAGLKPSKDFGKLLERARLLHFSGLDKPAALRQILAEAASSAIYAGKAAKTSDK